ncbi:MAG TPA: histidine phosphatase family protein [Ramlibacter sp.]|uniref:histidine phosphatase family protein n=1 Tax=Ramlibacter sp. TaxID=1917967 RepID=UPI002D7FB2B3|nr:histidine phosphatase family protein [Ramlibacter sp.]HET8747658.1 histidine phosphatase family protein [Ramlibacter sp.]
MTTTFSIVRHAAHDWLGRGFAGRQPDVSLNAQGREEAGALVRRLQGVPLDAIYCSPQPRTQQTAAPLAAQRGLEIRVEAAFDEVDLGEWQGRTFDEVRDQEAWKHWLAHRGSAQPPGGEPFAEVARRASAGLRRLAELHPQQHVLVVSHGDVIKAMVATVLGLSLDNLESFDIAPCSISVIAMGREWAQVRLLNSVGAA